MPEISDPVEKISEIQVNLPQTDAYELKQLQILDVKANPTLLALLAEIRHANLNLKSLATNVKATQYLADIEAAKQQPQADLELSADRQKSSDGIFNDKPRTVVGLSLNTSWAIDLWGNLSDQAQAAQFAVDSEQYQLLHAQNVVLAEACHIWIDLSRLNQTQRLLQARLSTATDLANIEAEHYTQGLSDFKDVQIRQLSVSELQTELVNHAAEQKRWLHRLNVLRGQSPDSQFPFELDDIQAATSVVPEQIDTAYLAERPDIQAGFKKVQMLDLQTQAAFKAMLPQFTISASLAKQQDTLSETLLTGGVLWQLVGSMVQPLFDGGQLRLQAERQSKETEAALFDYEQLVISAMEEVANAMNNEQALLSQWQQAKFQQQLWQQQFDSMQQSYVDGDTRIQDLLELKQTVLSSEQETIRLRSELYKNRISLTLALGLAIDNQENEE